MRASDLVDVWERGQGKHPIDRALIVLSMVLPAQTYGELADLTIGQRNWLLLNLRERTIGPTLSCFDRCPSCQEALEFAVAIDQIRVRRSLGPEQSELRLTVGSYELAYRLLTSRDLAALRGARDVARGRQLLVRRCVLQAWCEGDEIPVNELPDDVLAALADEMPERDPQSEIRFRQTCPRCATEWSTSFDVESFFWTELAVLVRRLLREVHVLARAYSWREAEILAMTSARRQMYLDQAIDA